MNSIFVTLGALSAFLGVGFGAFGAHAMKSVLSPEALAVYHTGVDYQMWHALGLLVIGGLHQQQPDSRVIFWAGVLMFVGILLFSGSLYLLAIYSLSWLGILTPLGGVCFLIAWLLLFFSFYKRKTTGRYH